MGNINSAYDSYMSIQLSQTQSNDPASSIPFYSLNLQEYLPLDKSAKIFDIGFGMGHFLFFLLKREYTNVQGIEVCREEYNYVKANITPNVFLVEDTLDYLRHLKEKYDLITLLHVIEHYTKQQIVPILKLIANHLTPKGKLIVLTPNMSGFTGLYNRYMDFTHEIGFTEFSLREVLRMGGFTKVELAGEKYGKPKGCKSILWHLLRLLYFAVLPIIYRLERGGNNPKIFSKALIAVVRR